LKAASVGNLTRMSVTSVKIETHGTANPDVTNGDLTMMHRVVCYKVNSGLVSSDGTDQLWKLCCKMNAATASKKTMMEMLVPSTECMFLQCHPIDI
jgi:hypothetical protein